MKEDNIITRAMYLRGGGHYSRKEDNKGYVPQRRRRRRRRRRPLFKLYYAMYLQGRGPYLNNSGGSVYVCYSNLLYCGGWGEGDIIKINFLSSFPSKTL